MLPENHSCNKDSLNDHSNKQQHWHEDSLARSLHTFCLSWNVLAWPKFLSNKTERKCLCMRARSRQRSFDPRPKLFLQHIFHYLLLPVAFAPIVWAVHLAQVVLDDTMKEGYINWTKCEPRAMLIADLEAGILTVDEEEVSAEEAWELMYKDLEEFKDVCFEQFEEKLAHHRTQVKRDDTRVAIATFAYEDFRRKHPRPTHNSRGEPLWDISPAKPLLKEDIKEKLHLRMDPSDLRETRDEYKAFDLDVFRGHIYQECRLLRFYNHLEQKREEKERKDRKLWRKQKQQRDASKKQSKKDAKDASKSKLAKAILIPLSDGLGESTVCGGCIGKKGEKFCVAVGCSVAAHCKKLPNLSGMVNRQATRAIAVKVPGNNTAAFVEPLLDVTTFSLDSINALLEESHALEEWADKMVERFNLMDTTE